MNTMLYPNVIYSFTLTVSGNSDISLNIVKGALLHVSTTYVEVVAVIVELIALDLPAIFRCTVISKKGLSFAVTVGQMGTH